MSRHSSYLSHIFGSVNELENTVAYTVKQASKKRFDAIAVRGVSGITIGSIVAYAMKKPLVVVRKPKDGSHGECKAEGLPNGPCTYLVIDDFISSGHTVASIVQEIHDESEGEAELVGSIETREGHRGFKSAKSLAKFYRYVDEAIKGQYQP
jgi:adenine/guanine phosphoribosyltransferase-like PRPP-binding protein